MMDNLARPLLRTAAAHRLGDALGGSAPWMEEAICAQADPDVWFPDAGRNDLVAAARRICKTCPVQLECFDASIEERWGIWAGVTERQRQRLRTSRRQGAA